MRHFLEEIKNFWPIILFVILAYFITAEAGAVAFRVDLTALWVYKVALALLPFLATALLAYAAYKMWLHYVQADFISGIDWVLLEIVPPRDVVRSPKAMELFITNALYHWSEKGGLETYWQGAVWFWFSLEIASIDGQVHFYIRTPTRVKGLIETQMYAQYPQAQVKVVEDYTLAVDKITADSPWNLWGCEFKLKRPDVFPIMTYVDFGLDKDPKEEYKVDPITPVVELFGSLQKGEQMWMQIVVRPSKKEYKVPGKWFKKHDWLTQGEIDLKKYMQEFTRLNKSEDPAHPTAKEIRLPDYLQENVKRAGAKMNKVGFDAGIRVCYVAKRELFNMNNRRNLRLIFRQYAAPYRNELWRFNATQADAFASGLFSGFFLASKKSIIRLCDRMLEEYREREFYHPPMRHKLHLPWPISPYIFPNYFHHHINILNTEELATLWHFPGQILRVPALERIESKEASPPTNLPT